MHQIWTKLIPLDDRHTKYPHINYTIFQHAQHITHRNSAIGYYRHAETSVPPNNGIAPHTFEKCHLTMRRIPNDVWRCHRANLYNMPRGACIVNHSQIDQCCVEVTALHNEKRCRREINSPVWIMRSHTHTHTQNYKWSWSHLICFLVFLVFCFLAFGFLKFF